MANTYQTTYNEGMVDNSPGTIAGNFDNARSSIGTCETETGIGFGLAVGRGADSDRGTVIGGPLTGFRGCSIKDSTLDVANGDKYMPPNSMGVLESGEIWVEPAVAVDINDPVHYVQATGVWTNTGGVGPVLGARWKTSCAQGGRAILQLPTYQPASA
jgi:hypothetical protein